MKLNRPLSLTPPHIIEMPKQYRYRYCFGRPVNVGRLVIAAGCLYELAALWSPLPTITTLVRRARQHRVLRVVAFAWCVLCVSHFVE